MLVEATSVFWMKSIQCYGGCISARLCSIQRTSYRDRKMFANHVKARSASACVLVPSGWRSSSKHLCILCVMLRSGGSIYTTAQVLFSQASRANTYMFCFVHYILWRKCDLIDRRNVVSRPRAARPLAVLSRRDPQ